MELLGQVNISWLLFRFLCYFFIFFLNYVYVYFCFYFIIITFTLISVLICLCINRTRVPYIAFISEVS